MLHRLPLEQGELKIRAWTRPDLDLLARWPAYPFPYRGFEFGFATMGPAERDRWFRARQKEAGALFLVVDRRPRPAAAIGYLGLRCVDWQAGTIGKVGVRVHPAWCGRGVGTSILRKVTGWSFEQGFERWQLDVAASNARAVRCYEKVGFVRTGEFWRGVGNPEDLGEPWYGFVRPHLREQGGRIELRFWVMQLKDETKVRKEEAL
jgi:RimJ/RimL family protein N-acetyltransferase